MNPFAMLVAALGPAPQAPVEMPRVLSLRERAELQDAWLERRLETLLPGLMRREGIDAWVLVAREYNEDPVVRTMLPSSWLSARRRTILYYHDHGGERGVERLAVARYDVGATARGAWDPAEEPDQWARLAELVRERDPARLALDVSSTVALADGLTHSEHGALLAALGPELAARVVSAEGLAVGWLETRTPEELEAYPSVVRLAHAILAEGLSERAVQPGATTTDDLSWWLRERAAGLGLDVWFQPHVSVQRAGDAAAEASFAAREGPRTIRRGDLVHVDFGIEYLGLHTDTQQHAYVLHAGEDDAPEGLRRALALGNRAQDLLLAELVDGRTGNEVLGAALGAARAEGLRAMIYTHPLGLHGHGAGPSIGLWDRQDGVPGTGDLPVRASTAWAIELGVTADVPEWGREVRVMLEEDALFDGTRVHWLDGRQTELHLIR